jgi:hypothetical protein
VAAVSGGVFGGMGQQKTGLDAVMNKWQFPISFLVCWSRRFIE